MHLPEMPETLRIADNISVLARFNEEKVWVEFVLTRMIPQSQVIQSTAIRGIIREAHSDWVYKQLEAVHDGIVDFKLEETGEEPRNLIRMRLMRTVGFDGRWHSVRVGNSFEVSLEM
jgi:KaiC/GvpD/RAD55 family RecA-like ATPase